MTVTGALPASAMDTIAFADAFDDLWAAGYRVAFRLLGDREDAADCAQESCVRACARWPRLVRAGDPTPWVVRVAANLAIDRWRRARRVPDPQVALVASDAARGVAERVDLHAALRALPRRQREVVVLRFVADLTEPDVARALGVSLGTVKQHGSRGLAALRAALAPRADTAGPTTGGPTTGGPNGEDLR